MASDTPFPIPATDGPTLADRMDAVRTFYMNGASDLMDRVAEATARPAPQFDEHGDDIVF